MEEEKNKYDTIQDWLNDFRGSYNYGTSDTVRTIFDAYKKLNAERQKNEPSICTTEEWNDLCKEFGLNDNE